MQEPKSTTTGKTIMPGPAGAEPRFGNISLFCAWMPSRPTSADTSALPGESATSATHGEEGSPAQVPEQGIRSVFSATETTSSQFSATNTDTDTASPLLSPTGHPVAPALATTSHPRFDIRSRPVHLTVWDARRLVVIPQSGSSTFSLGELKIVISRLLAAAHQVVFSDAPTYLVLHLGTVVAPKGAQERTRRRQRRPGAGGGTTGRAATPPKLSDAWLRTLVALVDETRRAAGIPPSTATHPTIAGAEDLAGPVRDVAYLEHFSSTRGYRGQIIVDPRLSLVIDGAEEDVRLLLWMAQQAPILVDGLEAASYAGVLTRISLWDASADTEAMLDEMNRSSNASTQGQILLNFALAFIGVLLALTQLPGARPAQLVAPMLLFAAAAISHAFMARTGHVIFDWIGLILLFCGVALALAIFLVPGFSITLLPNVPVVAPGAPIAPSPTPQSIP